MSGLIKGLHHITLCASGAQEDVDFCTKVMGQRLIKQTVLFDGRYAHYHFYYANANAEVGSVMTTFPYKRVPGRPLSPSIRPAVRDARGSNRHANRLDDERDFTRRIVARLLRDRPVGSRVLG